MPRSSEGGSMGPTNYWSTDSGSPGNTTDKGGYTGGGSSSDRVAGDGVENDDYGDGRSYTRRHVEKMKVSKHEHWCGKFCHCLPGCVFGPFARDRDKRIAEGTYISPSKNAYRRRFPTTWRQSIQAYISHYRPKVTGDE